MNALIEDVCARVCLQLTHAMCVGFIVVDEFLAAGPPDVWAVGDVCAFPYEGRHINVQHWAVAQQHGRVAAHNIVHRDTRRAYTQPPFFWSNAYGKGDGCGIKLVRCF